MMKRKKKIATTAQIERALIACKRGGMLPGSVELGQDGSIRIVSVKFVPNEPANDFDQYESEL